MVEREQIVLFLKSKGPSVPNDIKRALGGDSMIFGAMLSELISRGSVLITKVKKGTSPFYYVPGQEAQLEKLLEFCNPKDQKTLAFLKEKQVVRDQGLELFERVSLRQVPDFSKELKVNTANGAILFWRYYLLSEEDAIELLKKQYNKPTPVPKEEKEPVVQVIEEPEVQPKKEELAPKIQPAQTDINKDFIAQPSRKKESVQEFKSKPETTNVYSQNAETQRSLESIKSLDKTEFHSELLNYFNKMNIDIISQDEIKKNTEYEFVVKVPSALGNMEMYCRARSKKKLNEGDVAPALLKAKTKDLPCIFLTNGEFTKKSLLLIEEEYTGLIIKQL